ncbi:M56 family metallopeptidase [Aequorivita vladivostokensis]|uniref:BlaR1 peptidase M56 n=1 Tax=Aequorivita vladivostokensis TaxID=171194 RepID=A0ABR5DGF8_9FLAO|nr:M56 family metallopeptidase [Aequorivita vladivostokensis]KJJ37860.1 hypothetical protein MB09_12595 [Aequorivita vladivostokensis]
MIHTLFQILVFQILFLAIYDLFLKKETFFNLNRAYLLFAPVLGCVLPFISLGFIQQNIPQQYVFQLPAVVIGNNEETIVTTSSSWPPTLLQIWIVGILFSTIFLLWKLYKIAKLKSSGAVEKVHGIQLIILPRSEAAFSFFNTIFLGENISEASRASIIAHEKVHIKQKHSLDLLFFEVLRILFWFNPMVYLFQRRIATLHEYIADAEVAKTNDKKQYYQNLLSEVFQTENISFINTFFNQSLIKKRIIMLQKSKSTKTARLKYFLLVPAICGMLIYSSCSDETKKGGFEKSNQTAPIVVIDTLQTAERITDVPFSAIERVPVFPGCPKADNETMKLCMSQKIAEFVNSNFNIGLGKELNLKGRQRIAVQFKIDKTGRITDVRARAPKPELEAEAVRVVKLLPQMQPGEQKGEKVGVLYSLPIVFEVVE